MNEHENPPQMYQPPGIDTRPTSGLAVTSMVLGILCLCFGPLALVPLILGIIGILTTGANGQKKGQGFAIAGTSLGAVGVLGSCLSVGILLPALGKARQQAQLLMSQTQVQSIVQACIVYADNHDGSFPPVEGWEQALVDSGLIGQEILVSPREDGDGVSYIYLGGPHDYDASRIIVYEDPKHGEYIGVVVGFADGHTETISPRIFEEMLAEQVDAAEAQP
ncbi:MAG: DUF4190 domain-containing protein [Phycisphaerales bacterium]|nr:DUF4190 domain-containing protein [Phycisphaerales bacterium]